MNITVLTENTTCDSLCECEHGLSLYIETKSHKILFDAGQTDLFEANAQKLGIDLREVDIAILSHGHYDHGGGIKRFLEINEKAPLYISRHAFEEYWNDKGNYIGLDKEWKENERLVIVGDEMKIEAGLTLYSCNQMKKSHATNPFGLKKSTEEGRVDDDFLHEQYLLIEEDGKRILISGCSHKGILNIVKWFEPDVLIGGFHLAKLNSETEDKKILEEIAEELLESSTEYYTGHCTGIKQYEYMKEIMGERLSYIATGGKISLT